MAILNNIAHTQTLLLKEQVAYADGQVISKTLVQNKGLGITLFAFAKGEGVSTHESKGDALVTALEGEGVIVRMDDSTKPTKAGENPNLYVIHDDDLLRVINELRAAGAEAISVNGQRLTGVSEIRCAGPTLSVNNVRSSAPFEIRAIGEKKSLENSLRMRGGVVETLGVWGIQLDITASDDVYIPPYRGSIRQTYAHETQEREEESK